MAEGGDRRRRHGRPGQVKAAIANIRLEFSGIVINDPDKRF